MRLFVGAGCKTIAEYQHRQLSGFGKRFNLEVEDRQGEKKRNIGILLALTGL